MQAVHCNACNDALHNTHIPTQMWAFVILAVIGGYIGSLFTAFNTWICILRKRWSGWFSFRVLEVSLS